MLKHLFNEQKAAQAAAYFLFRSGKPLSVLKLMKLLYLAERRSFQKFGEPMIGDVLVSMDHGPVLSRTYNHIKGVTRSSGTENGPRNCARHIAQGLRLRPVAFSGPSTGSSALVLPACVAPTCSPNGIDGREEPDRGSTRCSFRPAAR